MIQTYYFLLGTVAICSVFAGIYFMGFWLKTQDKLFLWFGVAFFILAGERVLLLAFATPKSEDQSLIYLIRLVAFSLIIKAILDKNQKLS